MRSRAETIGGLGFRRTIVQSRRFRKPASDIEGRPRSLSACPWESYATGQTPTRLTPGRGRQATWRWPLIGPTAFPQGIIGPGATPPRGRIGMGLHMPILPDADRGIPKGGGRSRQRPPAPERQHRSGGRVATAREPAIYGSAGTHMEMAFRRTRTPLSDVHQVAGSYPATPKGLTGIGSPIPAI